MACTSFGNIISLDGVGYRHKGAGEYVLFTSKYLDIQVSVVPCHQSSRCVNAVAMVTSASVITIHAPYKAGDDSTIWINKEQTFSLRTSVESNPKTFILERYSWTWFKFSTSGLFLNVRVFGRYLDLTLSVTNSSWCSNSKGLWGSCDRNSSNYLVTRNGLAVSVEHISQNFIDTEFAASWKVPGNVSSVFVYSDRPMNEPRQKTGAGYCLRFKDTGLTTRSVFSLAAGDVTLEVVVKSDGLDGTILSYSTTSTLALVVKGTLKLFYGSMEFDTFLTLQTHVWSHLSLVWTKSNKILQFLLIDIVGKVHVRNFPINTDRDVFEPGGTLTLGYSYPSPVPMLDPIPGGFFGEVDELRVWNTRLRVSDIVRTRKEYIDCNSPNLANLWRFDEGEGNLATDCVSGVRFDFPARAKGPSWVYSSAPLKLTNFRVSVTDAERSSEEKCNRLLFGESYGRPCSSLPLSLKQFYAMGCYELILADSEMKELLWSVFSYLDYCQVYLGLSKWPGKKYCGQITVSELPDWVRLPCNEQCAFGKILKNEKCECRRGFYGKECSHECPGGFASPCGHQAKCNAVTGKCKCPLNANGSNDCLTCSPGWTGKDCSVAVVKSNARAKETMSICQGYGGGHFTTFDGSSYNLKMPGEFYLVNRRKFVAQVRQVPCVNSSNCVAAIALRLGQANVTFRAPYKDGGRPLLYINQQRADYTQQHNIGGGYFLKQGQPNQFHVWKGRKTILRLRVQAKYISFNLASDSETCWNASGLCSSCDNDTSNDFLTVRRRRSTSLGTQIDTMSNFVKKWFVPPSDSMFIYREEEKREISSSRYCLQYNGTAVDTRVIQGSFTTSLDITIEFFVKVESFVGTILSYSSDKTFGIVNDNTVKLQYSINIYDTGVSLQLSEWYWLTISFSKVTKMLRFYCLDSNGLMRQRTFLIPHVLFTPGGTLSLGRWQITGGDVTNVNGMSWNGYVDELRIWTRLIEACAVKQSRDRIIKYNADGLVALWLFDEGEGTVAHDVIGGHHFYMPVEPTARPQWVFSYALTSLPTPSSRTSSWKNQSLKVEAMEACRRFILGPVVDAKCGSKLGLAHSQFYYISCLEDVKASGSITSAYRSIVSYADYCRDKANILTWPLDSYCNDLPKAFVTNIKGPFCNLSCLFGDVDANGKDCLCWRGYWGVNCSNVCPGGAIMPCNGHGKCSGETGKCECEHNWMGNELCTKCTLGWHGKECSVSTATGKSSCVGFTGGHYQTFDGVRFSFLAVGEFKLIQSSSFVMHIRQVPCYNGRFRCIDGVAFRLNSAIELAILASVPGSHQPVVWLNSKRLEINQMTISIGTNYILEQTSLVTSVLRSGNNQTVVKMRFIGKRLQFIAQVPKHICRNSFALGGNCDGIPGNDYNGSRGASLEKVFGVSPEASLFSAANGYKDFSAVITGSEYALKFDGIGVITDILPAVFSSEYVTVELVYQTFDRNGTLFTYSKEVAFSIVLLNGEFCLKTNEMISRTGIKTTLFQVNHRFWSL